MKANIQIPHTIKLVNNYYFEILEDKKNLYSNVFDIRILNLNNIRKTEYFLIKLDFGELEISEYKNILRRFLKIKRFLLKKKIPIGRNNKSSILLGYAINYNKDNRKQQEFISAINAIILNSKYERYNYLYDIVCDYLDSFFYGKNLCEFKNNRCQKGNATTEIGCCQHFKYKCLGPASKFVLCEHLSDDKTCGAKCISCKLFTCTYLEKKGIKFRIKEILLLDTFFNPIQKYFIKTMVFTPKEKIIKRLIFFS